MFSIKQTDCWLDNIAKSNLSLLDYFDTVVCKKYFNNSYENPTENDIAECFAFYYKEDVPGFEKYMKVFVSNTQGDIFEIYNRVFNLIYDYTTERVILINDIGNFSVPFNKIHIFNKKRMALVASNSKRKNNAK